MNEDVQVVRRLIGPEEAAELLARNTRNRNPRQAQVAKLAADMAAGRWSQNGETVKVAIDGTLIDGQHRMLAVVQAGVKLPMLVVEGLGISAQETIDIGAARTTGDVLRLDGMSQSTRVAAVARGVLMYRNKVSQLSNPEIVEFVRAETDTLQLATELSIRVHRDLGGGVAITGAAAYYLLKVSVSDAIDFMEMFSGEIGVSRGHPVHALRSRFKGIKQRSTKNLGVIRELLPVIFKAWNLCVEGQQASLIRVGDTERDSLAPLLPSIPLAQLRAAYEEAMSVSS
jgi:hypothetical protein